MATLGANAVTLADIAKRLDPDGKIADIAELLSQNNEVLTDGVFKEGNLPTGHRMTVRTGLPTVAWRLYNQGVAPSKSTTAQITEQCGMLEAWSEVDKDEAELNGNVDAFRLSEGLSYIESMNQEMASTFFYGNSSTAPEEFTGLSIRYSDIGSGSPANSQNIISGAGSGSDNSSIWLVGWGDQSIFNPYPKGSKAGLVHENFGVVTVETTAGIGGTRMRAYQERWQWKCGVALKDWRYVVRIPNIDISNLVAKSSAADLIELMIKAIHRIPNLRMCKPVFYMNRSCLQMLDIQKRDDVITGGGLTYSNADGILTPAFRGIPIRVSDALTETEAAVA